MSTYKSLKKYITIISLIISFSIVCQAQNRQRNTIYVLDCTGSMGGYNGSPNIWESTKTFLKSELEKEAKENPTSKVTILPFQDKVLHPIVVNLNTINWPNLEAVLNDYLKKLTATNICDSWLEAEKYIDQSCDNYIVLMTDGHDNIGGNSNEPNRLALLEKILRNFCGKYENTKGFYVELTSAATLPRGILNAIDRCYDLYKIDATNGIPSFGCASEDVIVLNSRDLPTYIILGFSNSETFNTSLNVDDNSYLKFSIVDNQIKQGKVTIHVESKFGDDIDALNKAIDAPSENFALSLQSDDVIITNPELNVILNTTPLRSLELSIYRSEAERVKPFLWIKGNPSDTLRWDLKPEFSDEAVKDNSIVMFKVHVNNGLTDNIITFNGDALSKDSIIVIKPNHPAIIDLIIPNNAKDGEFGLSLNEITSKNLDRLNGKTPSNSQIVLNGQLKTSISILEIIVWCLLGIIVLFLLVWFLFIKNQKYPKFNNGILTIQSPYFATIRVKGYRKIVFTSRPQSQGFLDKIWKGKILYHVNPIWQSNVEISPSSENMRFRSLSNSLICSPQPLLMHGASYEITDTENPSFKIVININ